MPMSNRGGDRIDHETFNSDVSTSILKTLDSLPACGGHTLHAPIPPSECSAAVASLLRDLDTVIRVKTQ
jgi:hypothetical protein